MNTIERIKSKTVRSRDRKKCFTWKGKRESSRPVLLVRSKRTGRTKKVDVARALAEDSLGRKLEEGESASWSCMKKCGNPSHVELDLTPKVRRRFSADEISAFKSAVAGGQSVRAAAATASFSVTWAYAIAKGEIYSEIPPTGSVIKLERRLTAKQVARVRRLRNKKLSYGKIAERIGCHPSTARDVCLTDRPSWQE